MKNKRIYVLFSVLLVIFCSTIIIKPFQNDTFSAVKIGDYILHNGIDFVEHFNFNELVHHNARWLFNVIIAFIYNRFNYLGIYVFIIINSIILGLIMFNTTLKHTKNQLISFVITIISMELIGSAMVARAQTISYILLFLEVIFIERMISENKIKYLFILLPISVLVANIHTTVWLMTLILFLPYFAEYFLSKFNKTEVLYSETKSIKLLIISFIVIALSGLLTPLGLLPYTYIFKTLSGISSSFILEMRRGNIISEISLLIPFVVYFYILVIKRNRIKISDLFMILGLFFMSIMAVRNIPYLIVIGSLCLSRLLVSNIKIDKDITSNRIIIGIAVVFTIVLSLIFIYKNSYKKEYVDKSFYPVKASDYILNNIDLNSLRIYNDFDYGSYLEFRGIKVFVDSRAEMYCKEFNNTTILEDWYNASHVKTDYKSIFNKYNFNYVLLYNSEPLNKYVSLDEDYEIEYIDEYFVLYKKVE